jgi:hypothetical protein
MGIHPYRMLESLSKYDDVGKRTNPDIEATITAFVRHQTPPAGRHVFDWLNSLDMSCHVQVKMVVYVFAQSTTMKSYVFSYFASFFEKNI